MSISYHSGINPDLLALVPVTANRILEVGCGEGDFGRAYLARNPSSSYVGVELSSIAARRALTCLTQVISGDIEEPDILRQLGTISSLGLFDALLFGDILGHLRDPWQVLAELRPQVAPGGTCVACIPNVAHWSILEQQLQGRWNCTEAGLLDKTTLRFFTLDTAVAMFQQAGWTVIDAKPRILLPEQTEAAINAFAPLAKSIGLSAEILRRNLSAVQWVIRAVNGPAPSRVSIAAIGMKKLAGVTEARIDYPLAALATQPAVRATWGEESISIPNDWVPGALILHRSFKDDPRDNAFFEAMISRGWVIVADMDDDPHHWPQLQEDDYYAFKSVHAVTVSSSSLADMIMQWNPNVQVFPNAIFALPTVSPTTPKQAKRIRVFFGALNRVMDWSGLVSALVSGAQTLADKMEFVVVHDREFFDALPDNIMKEFHPTLPHHRYMALLASCDVALLPLSDSSFNRHKSDLKFIECCAAGVVPICSTVVYAERPVHRSIGVFADKPADWRSALVGLCSDTKDIMRRRAIGLVYVKQERMHNQQVVARESYYRQLLAQRVELETQRIARIWQRHS